MKKIFLLSICLFSVVIIQAQKDIYNLRFKGLTKEDIDMSAYRNKKLIIVVSDAANPDRQQLLSLDSLCKANPTKLAVLVLPVTDFGSERPEAGFRKLWLDTLKLSIQVARPAKGRKNHGNAQQDLLQWLTKKENNKHFDTDIKRVGEMFVVNERGKLYARLAKKVDLGSPGMTRILSQVPSDK